jgi:hypothetical protein
MLPACNHSKEFLINASFSRNPLMRIIAFLYAVTCPGCKYVYKTSRASANLLRSELSEKCPQTVLQTVYKQTDPEPGFIYRIIDTVFLYPRIAMGSSAIVAMLIVLMGYYLVTGPSSVPRSVEYTSLDVELARIQVEETLNLLIPLIHSAELSLKEDIIKRQVIPPLREGITATTELLSKGTRK